MPSGKDKGAQVTLVIRRTTSGEIYTSFKKAPAHGRSFTFPEILPFAEGLLNKDFQGTLAIDVVCQFKVVDIFIPHNYDMKGPLRAKMVDLLEAGTDHDVLFKVEDVIVPAHKLILRLNAPLLFDCCKDFDEGAPIEIDGIDHNTFQFLLGFIYAELVPPPSKTLICAANRFGVVGLKLATEANFVKSLCIDESNVIEWIIFAEANFCSLLKEYAIQYFIASSVDIVNSGEMKKLVNAPGLLVEVMNELSKAYDDARLGATMEEKFNSINDLRIELFKRGLDVDGSRTMLEMRLEESINKAMMLESI